MSRSDAPVSVLLHLMTEWGRDRQSTRFSEFAAAARLVEPGPDLVRHLFQHREALSAWFSARGEVELIGQFEPRLIRWVHANNQHLDLDAPALDQLRAVAASFAQNVARALANCQSEEDLETRLSECLRDAGDLLSGWLGRLHHSGGLTEVPAGEYSAELQLTVLGLGGEALADPILDIGCGTEARLVTALRARGLRAVGVDRHAAAPGCLAADWMALPIEAESWATIVSHLAFSLQFLRRHYLPGDDARRYAERYMGILRGLRPRGLFAYCPGLPFIEDLLPRERYEVAVRPVPEPLRQRVAALLGDVLGSAPYYASQVRSLS